MDNPEKLAVILSLYLHVFRLDFRTILTVRYFMYFILLYHNIYLHQVEMFYFRGSFYSIKKQSNVYDECLTHINYIVDDPCTPVDCLHGNCLQ